ncbi:LysR family transcriptional regulator [Streptomyces sp. URMC 123]|uniref:LysR family transcriptional regulator n=1 Tax=Streptomyces sp. URMC 123 TaxID=3423403 RepID=UPI003F198ABA
MTLDDLRVFVAVCDSGSLSAVARDLSRTQSAVSQHVKRLEREVGLRLLERRPRGVTPTAAGRILHAAAAEGIGGIDLALRRLGDLLAGAGGSVRVTTGATTVRHFMSHGVVAFRQRFPEVSLEFETESSSRGCYEALAADRADLAWVTLREPVRGIEQRPVLELPWMLAVRTDDPLAGRGCLDPADLRAIRPIGLPGNSSSRSHLEEQLASLGVRLTPTTGVADWDTAILLAELGLGHAVVPRLPDWDAARHPTIELVPVPALRPLSVGWAARRWDALNPVARDFADTVTRDLCERAPAGGRGEA